MQAFIIDHKGELRFKANPLVKYLIDKGNINLTDLLIREDTYSGEDYEQLMQLIGYSLGGYCAHEGVSDEAVDAAVIAAKEAGFDTGAC